MYTLKTLKVFLRINNVCYIKRFKELCARVRKDSARIIHILNYAQTRSRVRPQRLEETTQETTRDIHVDCHTICSTCYIPECREPFRHCSGVFDIYESFANFPQTQSRNRKTRNPDYHESIIEKLHVTSELPRMSLAFTCYVFATCTIHNLLKWKGRYYVWICKFDLEAL